MAKLIEKTRDFWTQQYNQKQTEKLYNDKRTNSSKIDRPTWTWV